MKRGAMLALWFGCLVSGCDAPRVPAPGLQGSLVYSDGGGVQRIYLPSRRIVEVVSSKEIGMPLGAPVRIDVRRGIVVTVDIVEGVPKLWLFDIESQSCTLVDKGRDAVFMHAPERLLYRVGHPADSSQLVFRIWDGVRFGKATSIGTVPASPRPTQNPALVPMGNRDVVVVDSAGQLAILESPTFAVRKTAISDFVPMAWIERTHTLVGRSVGEPHALAWIQMDTGARHTTRGVYFPTGCIWAEPLGALLVSALRRSFLPEERWDLVMVSERKGRPVRIRENVRMLGGYYVQ